MPTISVNFDSTSSESFELPAGIELSWNCYVESFVTVSYYPPLGRDFLMGVYSAFIITDPDGTVLIEKHVAPGDFGETVGENFSGTLTSSKSGTYTVKLVSRPIGLRPIGSVSGNGSVTYVVDNTPPEIFVDKSSQDYAKEAAVVINATDADTDVASLEYAWSTSIETPSSWISISSGDTVTQTDEGEWYLHVQATDAAGNTVTKCFGTYDVELTAPTVTFDPVDRPWESSQVQVNLSVTDTQSGVDQIKYKWTNSTATPTSGWITHLTNPITISENGEWYLHVQAIDNAGNVQNVYGGSYQIDGLTPEAHFSIVNRDFDNTPVEIDVTLSDVGGSGLDTMEYAVTQDTDTPTEWLPLDSPSETITITEAGVWYLHLKATDVAGNVLTTYRGYYRIRYVSIEDGTGNFVVPTSFKYHIGGVFIDVDIYRWSDNKAAWILVSKA